MLTETQLILVELEAVEGTDPTPTTSANFLAVHNVSVTPNITFNDTMAQDGSLSARAGTLGQKYIDVSFDHELQVNNSSPTVPPCDALLQACGWDDNEESTTDGKYYPASPRGLSCTRLAFDSGGTTAIAVGDTVVGEDSGASAAVRAVTLVSGTWAGGDAAGFLYLGDISRTVGLADFSGAGLDDATAGGTYTGTADATYEVVIDATGTPDTFKWRKDGGAWTSTVSITGSAQTLSDGVTVTFGATTGHTLDDQWTITANGLYEDNEALLVSSTDRGTADGTQWVPSVTIWVYQGDVLWKINGCKGEASLKLEAGKPAIASFSMKGLYATPVDDTLPTSWTDNGGSPLVAMGGTFTWNSETPVVANLAFGLNNTVNMMPSLAATHGVQGATIVGRLGEASMDPEATLAADIDYFTPLEAGTLTALSYALTNSTVDVDISLPTCELMNVTPGDRNGVFIYDIPMRLVRSANSAGEDEAYIQFSAT